MESDVIYAVSVDKLKSTFRDTMDKLVTVAEGVRYKTEVSGWKLDALRSVKGNSELENEVVGKILEYRMVVGGVTGTTYKDLFNTEIKQPDLKLPDKDTQYQCLAWLLSKVYHYAAVAVLPSEFSMDDVAHWVKKIINYSVRNDEKIEDYFTATSLRNVLVTPHYYSITGQVVLAVPFVREE